MAHSQLESFPTECLQEICKHVYQAHRQSVLAFALVSKKFYAAGTLYLFHTTVIKVRSRKLLVDDINRIRPEVRTHIRHLVIKGRMPRRQEEEEETKKCASYASSEFITPDKAPIAVVYEEDDAWLPLCTLISEMPALSDLTYNCTNQFSPCLLRALQSHHPSCRLHLETFQLVSVGDTEPDAHEIALASSPCLYSLKATYNMVTRDHILDFTRDAILDLVNGLAPNLKRVSTTQTRTKATRRIPISPTNPCKSLRKQPNHVHQNQVSAAGSLLSLSLHSDQDFARWARVTDLSKLRVLTIWRFAINLQAFDYLEHHCSLPSLKELSLRVEHAPQGSQHTYDAAVGRFIRSLTLLTHLELSGGVTRVVFEAVISQHGGSLQNLQLHIIELNTNNAVIQQSDVQLISEKCLKLQTLAINVPRSCGDANEVAIYQSLGRIRKLRDLTITLDASCRDVGRILDMDEEDRKYESGGYDGETENDPSFNEFQAAFYPYKIGNYRKIRNGHVMNSLINSALDETLAQSIFGVISSSKPATTLPLESLDLYIRNGGTFGNAATLRRNIEIALGRSKLVDINTIFNAVSNSFKIERNIRDDRKNELIVTTLTEPHVLKLSSESRQLEDIAEQIFRRVWPRKSNGNGKWSEDWSSFPLQLP
jgi:hypothetical protein